MSPKISIIIPVYNTEHTLQRCVESVKAQTFSDLEIILVDDGSPDGAGAMCNAFAEIDPRIKVIHKENGGLSSARNAGMEIATGEYIGFVDSDDYIHPQMYEKLYERIIADCSDICICAHFRVDVQGNVCDCKFADKPDRIVGREEIEKHLILPLIGVIPGAGEQPMEGFAPRNLYRRDLICSQPFLSEREYFAEDVLFNLSLYSRSQSISIVNQCYYYYRYNGDSLSNRHRPGLHILLERLLCWEEDFLLEHGLISERERLLQTGLQFIIFSVRNVQKSSLSLKDRILMICEILNQKILRESVRKARLVHRSRKQQIIFLGLRVLSFFA